ncbi:MAG: Gfo/Idh/MocA family oxidoreductase [Armatimonadota bacterium]|nr:Gfo/Idh/MocA family oxidoreductase [Armatimonadota bacterium]
MAGKRRFAQVGMGSRSGMYFQAIVGDYADTCEMVGCCDTNEGRLNQRVELLRSKGADVKGYLASDFDRMIAERKPDCVIVTTKDCEHDTYICRAMELGCDVITEKPMTIDEHKCRRVIDTQRKTGKKCTVTFNYRYSPPRTQIKDLLMSGIIGDVISVDFHWMLNTGHGADYFRRWHRNKENSGGLLVHKATHHFDIINWVLSAVPETVYARGFRKFYTPKQADRYGLTNRAERCLDCPEKSKCKFVLDLRANDGLRSLYLDNEQYDGYFRDRCVFSNLINIEDTMFLTVTYDTGAVMSYSLTAFSPWEGYTMVFNGSKGRLEHKCQESVYISGDGTVPGALQSEGTWVKIYPHFAPAYEVEVWEGEGGHGGGDARLLDDVFNPNPTPSKYKHAADQRSGAYSILTGVAANRSMESGKVIRIDDLVQNIGRPDYTPMPSPDEMMG